MIINTNNEAAHRIGLLAQRFEEQKEFYRKAEYNETLTRRDFIDPFFKALGWDIDNENGYAESYREVIHEDRVRVGDATKAPDYSFRLVGGKRLFFVEAKKPSIYIQKEVAHAYQVRRYGWSAKLPISIITDFEEFAIYDCTKKPNPGDKASTARIKYLTYNEYVKDFDFIWETFSKERVLKGSFDRFVKSDTYKKGTATVDREFLQSLDKWRELLALNISINNPHLDEDEINFVVQQTIDRIIFLRIAEDRSIEPYGNLKDCLKSGDLYQNLFSLFEKADEKYNSGLFDFNKDRISGKIGIGNKVIKSIIQDLYYPQSPYAFSVLPVEILGTAYEQFLGKQIKIAAGNKARIEEKPEVRKAGGVYYTPQHIVSGIVEHVLGRLVSGKTPAEISRIKIVDPACGSGSFLLGAYEYLLTYHRNYYSNNGKKSKGSKTDVLTPGGELTTAEKKRILLNNIFGVDLDSNAVEVTRLSLLIKCMEGETAASIATQMRLFHDRVLPTLDENIKNGNSLVDLDFYDEAGNGEEKKIKPLNWQKTFPNVFKSGGFDAVIGNPPYVQVSNMAPASQQYFSQHYHTGGDLFSLFIEKSLGLLKDGSLLGFIVPSLFLKGVRYQKLREMINGHCSTAEIRELGDGVFEKVNMPTCIVLLEKGRPAKAVNYFENSDALLFKNVAIIRLGDIAGITRGLEIGKDKLMEKGDVRCITGAQVDVYLTKGPRYISRNVLRAFSKKMEIFRSPKIMVRETGNRFFAAMDYTGVLTTRSIYNIKITSDKFPPEFVLGLINSKLFCLYFSAIVSPETNVFPKIRIIQLKELPLPANPDPGKVREISQLVVKLMEAKTEAAATGLQARREQLLSAADFYSEKIDLLVYEIYALTEQQLLRVQQFGEKDQASFVE